MKIMTIHGFWAKLQNLTNKPTLSCLILKYLHCIIIVLKHWRQNESNYKNSLGLKRNNR